MKYILPTARSARRIKKIKWLPKETIVISNKIDFDYEKLRFQCFYSRADGYWNTMNAALKGMFLYEPFVWLADDIQPQRNWHKIATQCYQERFPGGLGIVVLNDLNLLDGGAAFAVTTRAWLYVLFGEPRFPDIFGHNFLDTLIANRSKDLGCYYFCKDSVVEHLHHSIGKSEYDEVYKKNQERAANYRDKGKKDRLDHEWTNCDREIANLRLSELRAGK